MGSAAVKMSFYLVTTEVDGEPTETLLYEDVSGALETASQIAAEKERQVVFIRLLVFYPGSLLSGIVTGMKVVDDQGNVYTVQYEETYSDHQEIYMRLVNQ
jgi:hypothetical protein